MTWMISHIRYIGTSEGAGNATAKALLSSLPRVVVQWNTIPRHALPRRALCYAGALILRAELCKQTPGQRPTCCGWCAICTWGNTSPAMDNCREDNSQRATIGRLGFVREIASQCPGQGIFLQDQTGLGLWVVACGCRLWTDIFAVSSSACGRITAESSSACGRINLPWVPPLVVG